MKMSEGNALAPYTDSAIAAYERAESLQVRVDELEEENRQLRELLDPNRRILDEKEKRKEFKRIIKWLRSLNSVLHVCVNKRAEKAKISIFTREKIAFDWWSYSNNYGSFFLGKSRVGNFLDPGYHDMSWKEFINFLILKGVEPEEFEREVRKNLAVNI
jgi:hypothetical protein